MSDVPPIHLFEPSGFAGIFQHACRLAQLLGDEGVEVVVHTGHHHERVAVEGVDICPCSWWPRDEARGPRRSAAIATRFVTRTLPHLRRAVPRGGVLHVEGPAAAGMLTLTALTSARLAGRRVVYSPHDRFSRYGHVDAWLQRRALRMPHALVMHSEADVAALRAEGVHAEFAPLIQLIPAPSPAQRQAWRASWGVGDDDQVVLFAGFIRPEKRLDLVIRSAASWPANRRLAVVGQDFGAWEECARLARSLDVHVEARIGFVDLDEFAAALVAADVVVAPHERASQSGVLSVASQLGVPTVAAAVGGLGELAQRTFAPGDVADLTRTLDAQLAKGPGAPTPSVDEALAVRAHLDSYGRCVPQATFVGMTPTS